MLSSIVSENQSAFIPGRAIADNVLITHEVLQFLKTSKAEKNCTMAVKTDMSKAYDRIEWSFVQQVLQRLGFNAKWINWLMQCITTVSYSYLVNDSVYGEVKPYRGIRQGDPLSPYVFILCSEVLSGLCKSAEKKGLLQGVRVARGSPRVSHLLFADDTMFFGLASATNCETLMKILKDYERASGQMINKSKSSVTFSSKSPPEVREQVKSILGITKEGGLGKYLGLPEHFGRRKKDLFTSIVDRIRQKAISWSSSKLSRAGKLTMLKAVLSAIPTYTMSCFMLPVSLCKRIQSVLTRFWWDGADEKKKICWVAWDRLTKTKEMGGLGLRDIQTFNQALLAKLAWRLVTAPESLLARVLFGKYCHGKHFLDVESPKVCSHGWRGILFGRDLLTKNLGKAVGNGQTIRLWKDSWISLDKMVKPMGPIKESDLDLTVSDLLTDDLSWNSRRIKEVLPEFLEQIICLQPSRKGAEDSYIWHATSSGVYSTKSGYFAASTPWLEKSESSQAEEFHWIKDIWAGEFSPKMKAFLWAVVQKAIPIGENLYQRGVRSAAQCLRCNEHETSTHLFFTCPFAKRVWRCVPLHSAVHIAAESTFKEAIVKFRKAVCLPPSGFTLNILPWICWVLWTSRNALVFEDKRSNPEDIALKGLRLAKDWMEAQGKTSESKIPPKPKESKDRPPDSSENPPPIVCATDAAWNASRKTAGLGWTFSGPSLTATTQGSRIQASVNSPLIAEALAVRTALYMALTLDFTNLKVCSDNSTLIRAINSKSQSKEIIGIVSDIQVISSEFTSISFSFIPRSENSVADGVAKAVLLSSFNL